MVEEKKLNNRSPVFKTAHDVKTKKMQQALEKSTIKPN